MSPLTSPLSTPDPTLPLSTLQPPAVASPSSEPPERPQPAAASVGRRTGQGSGQSSCAHCCPPETRRLVQSPTLTLIDEKVDQNSSEVNGFRVAFGFRTRAVVSAGVRGPGATGRPDARARRRTPPRRAHGPASRRRPAGPPPAAARARPPRGPPRTAGSPQRPARRRGRLRASARPGEEAVRVAFVVVLTAASGTFWSSSRRASRRGPPGSGQRRRDDAAEIGDVRPRPRRGPGRTDLLRRPHPRSAQARRASSSMTTTWVAQRRRWRSARPTRRGGSRVAGRNDPQQRVDAAWRGRRRAPGRPRPRAVGCPDPPGDAVTRMRMRMCVYVSAHGSTSSATASV